MSLIEDERKVTDSDYHRNGVAGEGFFIGIIRDEDGTDKLFITFADYDEEGYLDSTAYCNPKTAILDLDLLAERKIAFGLNSWRGDQYHHVIMDHLVKEEKESNEELEKSLAALPKAEKELAEELFPFFSGPLPKEN